MGWRAWVSCAAVIMTVTCLVPAVQAQPTASSNPSPVESDTREVLYRDFLLTMLSPYIHQAIFDHYGEHRSLGLYQAHFRDIKRLCDKGQFYFEATVVVETWTGAHNPPYGLEIITLTNYPPVIGTSGKPIHILNYVHQDLSPTEPTRLPLRRNC